MKFLSQPKLMLLVVALVTILTGFVSGSNNLVLPGFHTLIISEQYFCIYFGSFILFEALVYYATDNFRQSRSMQILHVISIVLILLITICRVVFETMAEPEESGPFPINIILINIILWMSISIFFFFGQYLFIVNIVQGFIRGRKA